MITWTVVCGLMLGVEYAPEEDTIIIDLLFIRIMVDLRNPNKFSKIDPVAKTPAT